MTIPITTLTPAQAQQNLQNDGLDTLGLTTVRLGPRWADTTPVAANYDPAALTLGLTGDVRAPFLGIREFAFSPAKSTLSSAVNENATTLNLAAGTGSQFPSPVAGAVLLLISNASGSKREIVACTARAGDSLTVTRGHDGTAKQGFDSGDTVALRLTAGSRTSEFLGADGAPLTGPCAVLRLHPQAVLRMERLAVARYALPGAPLIRPVPWAVVVRGAQGFTTPRWFRADEPMTGISGPISFHDGRGQIIDPIYVAALFNDLLAALPGLLPATPSGPANGAGGVQQIAALATGTLVHVVDLHGGPYRKALGSADLVTVDGANAVTGTISSTGLVTLAAGNGIRAADADQGRLRWGWATNGVMARTTLIPPALPATGMPAPALPRQFFRVAAVDTTWFLLGNRTAATVLGVGPDDQRIPTELLPAVRDQVVIDYLADGPDMLAQVTAVLNRPNQGMILAVSPDVDGTMDTPALPGAAAHWPAYQGANTNAGFTGATALAGAVTATFTAQNDVVVTLAGGVAPDGAHVRIYPQQFVEIAAIAEEPSFLRADGGAAIAQGANPAQVLLRNPFRLVSGQNPPSPAELSMDIVIAPRAGRRRLFGAVSVTVAAGPAALPPDPFLPVAPQILGAMLPQMLGIAESPLFGIPRTIPPPPPPPSGDFLAMISSLAAEPSPRQAPRLPTMARFDTMAVTGTTGPGTPQPAGTLLWEAVLSGGRLTRESRSALHESGNPGNPAGPDLHAPGLRVTGALAYDVALLTLHRVQPLIPMPGTAGPNPGWVVASLGDNFNVPNDAANVANTGVGVLLQSGAVATETPLLSGLTPPPPNLTVQQMINDAAAALGLGAPPITITIQNEPRVQRDVRREFFLSKHGLRDAQWALRRAVAEARELVYIESPQFARTARPSGSPQPFEVDLVAELAARLGVSPNLKVLVCTPHDPDFATRFKGWWRQHFQARSEAIATLLAAAPDRVSLFHPVGFPGRTAFIRTTTVIVDDVWCLTGSTHFRRRGMTFDGSSAVASFDREMQQGYSRRIREFRRALMAAKLRVTPPVPNAAPSGDWVRLSRPASAFDLVADLLAQGGLGRMQPLYPGPADTTVLPVNPDVGDPEGSTSNTFFTTFAGMLNEAGD